MMVRIFVRRDLVDVNTAMMTYKPSRAERRTTWASEEAGLSSLSPLNIKKIKL